MAAMVESADMLHNRSMLLKLEKQYLLLLIWILCAWRVNDNNVVASNDARSRIWAISSSFDTIGLSYGPTGIVRYLGSRSGSKEGSWDMSGMEAIWGGHQQ